ncbi:MAG: endonuclease/exonuclease/phosphatase family protein [Deltaproteobacteria bacterium]|nr:endonuclease/exonuclease/phosphatase family protein [Deltaproteobacteria bacterium]
MIKIVSAFACLLIIAGAVFLYWGQLSSPHEAFINGSCDAKGHTPSSLKVVSYNIGFGNGLESEKVGIKNESEIRQNLDGIANFLKNADIALLQEVDLSSRRTHYIDEAAYLAGKAGFGCYACVTNWVKNFVPYPYWPISNQYGKMKSGECVLSRYPILNNMRLPLPQRTDKPFWYKAFYFDRTVQVAEVLVGDRKVNVVNNHLEPFDISNREAQGKELSKLIKNLSGANLIVGGDFNALPPNASIKKNFPDKPEKYWKVWEDVSGDETMAEFLDANSELGEAMDGVAHESETFTFPADNPNRRVDYLFFSQDLIKKEGKIVFSAGPLSDHLPVYLEVY